jgi:molecular chaperone GrpE
MTNQQNVEQPTAAPETGSTAPETDITAIEAQLMESQKQAADYLDQLQRERASFATYRRRTEKEREEIALIAAVDTLKRLLPVIDDFDRAIAALPAEKAADESIRGFTLIHRKLIALLESAGVKVVDPIGQPFDPAYHEAIGQDSNTDVPSGHITSVLQKGYTYGDKPLRPALVRVAE